MKTCFGAAYTWVVLHHGFHIGLDERRVTFSNSVRVSELLVRLRLVLKHLMCGHACPPTRGPAITHRSYPSCARAFLCAHTCTNIHAHRTHARSGSSPW